jgi:Protein of unknown function (DUF1565)
MTFPRLPRPWRHVVVTAVCAGLAGLLVLSGCALVGSPPAPPSGITPPPTAPSVSLYVSPSGSDTNDGSSGAPLQTIQAALDRAQPGATINLGPGVYHEQLATKHDGAAGARITIKGPETGKDKSGRYRATLYGTGRIFSINNSYYTLDGFTIDGQEQLKDTPFPTDLSAVDAFKDSVQPKVADGRLIYIGADEKVRDLTGITINNMFLNGAGGECVRLRNNAHDNTITDSVVQYCGLFGKGDGTKRATYHNGEGVYIGTSPNSKTQPMHDNDTSSNNVVARNVIRTFGSECFDVKENAHDNVFEDNVCSGNTEPTEHYGSNVELRGYLNTVRNNQISGSAGYTVKIQSDDHGYDKGGNAVENNHLSDWAGAAFEIKSKVPQGQICGNVVPSPDALVDGKYLGDVTAPCPAS